MSIGVVNCSYIPIGMNGGNSVICSSGNENIGPSPKISEPVKAFVSMSGGDVIEIGPTGPCFAPKVPDVIITHIPIGMNGGNSVIHSPVVEEKKTIWSNMPKKEMPKITPRVSTSSMVRMGNSIITPL